MLIGKSLGQGVLWEGFPEGKALGQEQSFDEKKNKTDMSTQKGKPIDTGVK